MRSFYFGIKFNVKLRRQFFSYNGSILVKLNIKNDLTLCSKCEHLHLEQMRTRDISGFSISFLNEALEGEEIRLKTGIQQHDREDTAWISGDHTRGRCFDACIRFHPQA